nr:hypothetical protein [uncultured Sharpea sp.]
MLDNYLDLMNITLEDMQSYFINIDPSNQVKLVSCFNIKKFKNMINDQYDYYLQLGINHLYEVNDYAVMEKELVMMNYFFHDAPAFVSVKKAMKKLVLGLKNPISMYRLLRHIMNLDKRSLISLLYVKGENEIEDAYAYLSRLNHEPSEALLALYASYDLLGAMRLTYHMTNKKPLSYAYA